MASSCSLFSAVIVMSVLVLFMRSTSAHYLTTNFYSKSCPKVFFAVNSVVKSAVSKEPRMGASLVRLFFHDCFVNVISSLACLSAIDLSTVAAIVLPCCMHGCDGSILLDDTSSFIGEKTAAPNNNSVRGFHVVDDIKSEVEKVCPGIVSCADILAIAARDSVVLLGGPGWEVKLGRRDSKTANFTAAKNGGFIPSPTSNLSALISSFRVQGLSAKDMVALSGAHTIGKARCTVFRSRIYNEANIDSSFAETRRRNCPSASGSGDDNLAPLDVRTPDCFDKKYFQNLMNKQGLLHSDQVLFNGGSTDSLVKKYGSSTKAFNSDFVTAIIKMGDIKPLTGSRGEIRKNCRKPN
ncbi:hypothetical protein QUC31_018333 [Theobroma cacao]